MLLGLEGKMEVDTTEINSNEELLDVQSILDRYERVGYDFFPSWTMDEPVTPDRVKMPTCGIRSMKEIDDRLDELCLVEGGTKTREYRELHMADRFYSHLRRLDASERYSRFSISFENEADIEQCRERYKDAEVFA